MSDKKTAVKYVTPKDANDLNRIQDLAIKSAHKTRIAIQVALVATMLHIGKHGDWTGAGRLVDGLGNTVNGRAIVEWFVKFCGLTLAEDGSGFDGIEKGHAERIRKQLEEAKDTMWWEFKVANPYKGWNADEELQRWIKKNKETQAKLANLNPEDRAKVNLKVNEATIQQVLAMVKFDEILTAENDNSGEPRAVAA